MKTTTTLPNSSMEDSSNTKETAPADSANETPFEKAIRAWNEIGLTSLQKKLDDEGVEMMEKQKTSVVTRKELAAKTKAFKKMDDDGKLNEIKALLKMYQTEIDSLTNRSKFAENAFMNVYQALNEAPDPKPLLEASIDSVYSAGEASKLRTENARLSDLVTKYADYDHIKSKLEKLEQQSSEQTTAKVQAKEAELKAIFDEKERSWKSKEEELERQVQELRANSEVTEAQLRQHSNNNNENVGGGRIAELEFVARDLERANGRVLELEKRNQDLRKDLEEAKAGTKANDEKLELEKRISDLEGENIKLVASIDSGRSNLQQQTSETDKRISSLERDLSYKGDEIEALRSKLDSQHDYEEVKRELDVLKSIEFSVGGDGNDDQTDETENEKLEKQLLARNKKLNDDLTMSRVSNKELMSKVDTLQAQVGKLENQLTESKNLNSKLEHDLSTMRETTPTSDTMSIVSGWNWGTASTAGGASVVAGSGPGTARGGGAGGGKASPTSSIIGGRGEPTRASQTDQSILPIITQQRDRFRTRNAELEQELKKTWSTVSSLRKELEAVKQDNVDLYEKTRYANTFRKPGEGTVSIVEDRYKSVYEEGLSPFQQFKGREAERVLSNMGPLERITYSFTKLVLANRTSRNFFMLYCIALHMLVMVVIMYGLGGHSPTSSVSIHSATTDAAVSTATDIISDNIDSGVEKIPAPE